MVRSLHFIATAAVALLLSSCEGKPTVQKYFVDKSRQKDFMEVDIAPSIIKTDKLSLSTDQKEALASVKGINVLVFKSDAANGAQYDKESADVKKILKSDKYDELIKFNNGGMGASINTKGEGPHIEEFVVYLQNKENGFGLIRVTGNNMTPNNVMTIASLLQKSDFDMAQLKPLQQLMLNKK